MKRLIFLALLLYNSMAIATTTPRTTFEPYVLRNEERSAEVTIHQLEGSPHLWEFQKELQTNTPYHFGHLTKAVEDRALVTKPCGDCFLETAGIRNGKTIYHRHVERNEMVAYLNGVPLFLPACGNPVRPLKVQERTPVPPVTPPTPVAQPPSAPPATPPPQVRKDPPKRKEGCSPDQVSYTTEVYHLPSTGTGTMLGWNWQFFDPGSITQTTSHHNWTCVHDARTDTPEEE